IIRNHGSEFEGSPDWSKLVEPSERSLLKLLGRFTQIVSEAAEKRKVHLLPLHLVEVASAFNEFYRDCPVLNETDEERKGARLALVMLARNVLDRGLSCLGIQAPEQM
ncbi:MAG: DALR anticodon-binding domain-containing protein, partial [Thermoplasmatota archaeon]